jgi:beta-galactosidase
MPFLNSLGASIHASWHLGYFRRDQYALGITANCDIIRAASAPKPFWVTELQGGTNIFSSYDPLCPSSADIAQWLWACIGSGAERVIFWTLNSRATNEEAGEWAMVNYQNEPSERLIEAGKIANILLKNNDLFKQAKPVNSDIYLLYSPESMIIFQEKVFSRNDTDEYAGRKQGAHIKSILAYYEALQEIGISCQVIQMDQFDWQAESKNPRTVILANMISVPSRFIDSIYTYVENGNKLIMTGMTGFFDEYMHNVNLSKNPFSDLLGAELKEYKFRKQDFDLILSNPQLRLPAHMLQGDIHNISANVISKSKDSITGIRNHYKNGEVIWIPSLIGLGAWQKDNVALTQLLKIEIEQAARTLPFCFKNHQPSILLRTLEVNGGYITILINSGDKTVDVEFKNEILLKPDFIFGKQREFANNTIKLLSQETVVINWDKK